MTLKMNPRIRCWTSRGRYGSGPDSADIFFGVWCENMASAFSNACEFLSFPFVAFSYGSHMPLSRGGPCPWEQTPNLPGKLCEPIWTLVMCKIKKLEHVCQPLCNVAAVVVVFNVSVIWVSINTLLPCCSQQNFFVYSWINTNENLKNPKKPVLCTDFIPRHHDLPILPTQDHLLRRRNIEPSNFWSNGLILNIQAMKNTHPVVLPVLLVERILRWYNPQYASFHNHIIIAISHLY